MGPVAGAHACRAEALSIKASPKNPLIAMGEVRAQRDPGSHFCSWWGLANRAETDINQKSAD